MHGINRKVLTQGTASRVEVIIKVTGSWYRPAMGLFIRYGTKIYRKYKISKGKVSIYLSNSQQEKPHYKVKAHLKYKILSAKYRKYEIQGKTSTKHNLGQFSSIYIVQIVPNSGLAFNFLAPYWAPGNTRVSITSRLPYAVCTHAAYSRIWLSRKRSHELCTARAYVDRRNTALIHTSHKSVMKLW